MWGCTEVERQRIQRGCNLPQPGELADACQLHHEQAGVPAGYLRGPPGRITAVERRVQPQPAYKRTAAVAVLDASGRDTGNSRQRRASSAEDQTR